MTEFCEHFRDIEPVTPASRGCEDCIAIGATWTELRVCLVCGHVGCCEDSQHAHALRHFNATGHPIIAPLERGETWSWCYVDRRYFELDHKLKPKRRSALAQFYGRLIPK